jgi:hypothetical protein|tara:strand:- start:2900 stop:3052 length:153 start_codon:yes stop_codon:yes gene_type:complete
MELLSTNIVVTYKKEITLAPKRALENQLISLHPIFFDVLDLPTGEFLNVV